MATTAKIAKEDDTRARIAADKAANKTDSGASEDAGIATAVSVAAGRAATSASSICAGSVSASSRSRARFPA